MKTTNLFLLLAALAPVAVFQTGCSKRATAPTSTASTATSASSYTSSIPVSSSSASMATSSSAIASTATDSTSAASTAMTSTATASAASGKAADAVPVAFYMVKDYSYERRDQYVAGIDRLAASMDEEHDADLGKAAHLTRPAEQAYNDAVRGYEGARNDLKHSLEVLNFASPDAWADAKAHVDISWQEVQFTFGKMKASLTQ